MATKGLLSLILLSLALLQVSNADQSCSMNSDSLKQAVFSCLSHEPLLMIQAAEHMEDPSSMASLDFVCSNQGPIVDTLMCLEKKMIGCLPQAGQILAELLPDRTRMLAGVKFVCDNRDAFSQDMNCMTQDDIQDFTKCYLGKLQFIADPRKLKSMPMIKSAMCSVIKADENCFQAHHGSCSAQSVKMVIQLVETLFPLDQCSAASLSQGSIKKVELKNSLGAILERGSPLLFQPANGLDKYRYKGYGRK